MSKSILILLFAAGLGLSGAAAAADADPSMHQVYEAASSGHLDQAQSMMAQVLKDHPDSAKAHYVEAELDAKQGKAAAAREEFQNAERLAPGLPFARPDAVASLRAELFPQQRAALQYSYSPAPAYGAAPATPASHFPWGLIISLGLIGAIVWALLRRRQQGVMNYGGAPGGPGYGGGYGGGYPPPSGGSGLLGSLGSGLAVGAGVVAGEELAHHFLDGNGNRVNEHGQPVNYPDNSGNQGGQNADMGGNDFGVSDSGSWDDNSGGGGGDSGGGDSWS
jgi:hypothetical protein